jgi:hypothetical protein
MTGRSQEPSHPATVEREHPESGLGGWLAALPSRWWIVALGVSTILLALVTIDPSADPDLFARVAVGRLIEVTGGVTDQDPFPFTPILDRWIDHEWLAGVVFYEVARMGGDWGLLALDLVLMVAMVILIVRAQHELRGASLGWSVLTLFLVFGPWSSIVRSRAFTLLFVSVLLLALVRWRNGRRAWLWVLPLCFLIWANAHGGFVAGLGLLGAASVAITLRAPRQSTVLWACLAACVAVTLINPYGLDYWAYILEATTMERTGITEWGPLRPWQIALLCTLGVLYVSGAWLRRGRREVLPETIGLLVVSLGAALQSQRLVNFLLLVLAVYGATEYRAVVGALGRKVSDEYRRAARHLSGAVALGAPVALLIFTGTNLASFASSGLSYARYPVGAVEWLHRHGAGGRLLTHFNHGSFALWRLYPLYQVAIDGRYEETYPQETVDLAWMAFQPQLPGHAEALQAIDPDYIIVPDPGWAGDLHGDWETVYADTASVVLARPGLETVDARPPRRMWSPGF